MIKFKTDDGEIIYAEEACGVERIKISHIQGTAWNETDKEYTTLLINKDNAKLLIAELKDTFRLDTE